jgi:hypothetical protein
MEIQTSGKPIDLLMENVLCMNILSTDYFKGLYRLKTYHEVIDEIYNESRPCRALDDWQLQGPLHCILSPLQNLYHEAYCQADARFVEAS